MRMIQLDESRLVVSTARPQTVYVPPFSLSGPAIDIKTQAWYPGRSIYLTEWYASARIAGTGNDALNIELISGDNLFDTAGHVVSRVTIPAKKTLASGPVAASNNYVYPLISSAQWMLIHFANVSTHEDVAVQIYAEVG